MDWPSHPAVLADGFVAPPHPQPRRRRRRSDAGAQLRDRAGARMNATLSRLLLLVHGQPDTMETPLPGYWGRSGGARVDTHEAMKPRPCVLDFADDCELACDVAPDAYRNIAPPPPLPEDVRSRLKRRALFLSALAFGALAGLLEAFGASPFPRDLP